MNAVERLWRALEGKDWAAARRQFHPGATISLPHTGQVLTLDDYLMEHAAHRADGLEVRAISGPVDERPAAVRAVLEVDGERWHVAGFYDLQQARISGAVELWVRDVTVAP